MRFREDVVVIGAESPEQQAMKDALGPVYVKPGTGGKHLRWPNGRECGPIDGEALRLALARGAVIMGEEPIQTFSRPTGRDALRKGMNIA